KLPGQPTNEGKDELVKLIGSYVDWQTKLPDQTFEHLSQFIPALHVDSIKIPEKLELIAKENAVTDYGQALNDFNSFIDQRIKGVSVETQD
ncbi:hypothetical protein JZU61_06055, partial [bacterium]|nr:hypothetical protein [bacterium]